MSFPFATTKWHEPQLPPSNLPHSIHFISTPSTASHSFTLPYESRSSSPPPAIRTSCNKVQPHCTLLVTLLYTRASAAEFPTEHAVARKTCLVGSIALERWCVISRCCPNRDHAVIRAVRFHSVREQLERKKAKRNHIKVESQELRAAGFTHWCRYTSPVTSRLQS